MNLKDEDVLLTVEKWNETSNLHIVRDENGKLRRMDMFVNGDFPEGTNPLSLIGKTYRAEWTSPYEEIAHNLTEELDSKGKQ